MRRRALDRRHDAHPLVPAGHLHADAAERAADPDLHVLVRVTIEERGVGIEGAERAFHHGLLELGRVHGRRDLAGDAVGEDQVPQRVAPGGRGREEHADVAAAGRAAVGDRRALIRRGHRERPLRHDLLEPAERAQPELGEVRKGHVARLDVGRHLRGELEAHGRARHVDVDQHGGPVVGEDLHGPLPRPGAFLGDDAVRAGGDVRNEHLGARLHFAEPLLVEPHLDSRHLRGEGEAPDSFRRGGSRACEQRQPEDERQHASSHGVIVQYRRCAVPPVRPRAARA